MTNPVSQIVDRIITQPKNETASTRYPIRRPKTADSMISTLPTNRTNPMVTASTPLMIVSHRSRTRRSWRRSSELDVGRWVGLLRRVAVQELIDRLLDGLRVGTHV